MLHSHRNNNIVKHLHKRCLRLIYNDKSSSSDELLQKGGSFFIYYRKNENLAAEMFKVKNDLSLETVTSTFLQKTQYNLRHHCKFL